MDTVLDRLESSIKDNIELENDLGMDAESLGIKELQNRYELFDNIKNEAFRLDNEHELTEDQKERIDKITDIAYDKANQYNLIAERKRQEYLELGKRRIELNRQIKRLQDAIEKDSNIANVKVAAGYEMPENLAKLQDEARKRIEENKHSLDDLISEKKDIIQKMRDLQFGERPKEKEIDKTDELNEEETKISERNDTIDNIVDNTLKGNVGTDSTSDSSNDGVSNDEDIEESIEPLPPVNEEVEEQEKNKEEDAEKDKSKEEEPEENIELDEDVPQIPNVKANKPKITWKTVLHVAAGIGIGAAVFFTTGPLGVGVMSLAGGLTNKFLKQRRNEIARLNRLGIKTKINTVVEPRSGLKGLVDRVKNRFRTEDGIRDVSWMINSAIITGTTLTVASTVNNIIQARSAATPTPETPRTPTSPEPTVSPEPTPIKATPQQTVQQPVSQYDGIRIGDGVGKYNVSTGHISSDRAVMGIDSKPLLSEYVNENSIFGRFASVNPDGSIGQVINTNGLSIEEFCAANGIDPSRVAVSVMDKAGVDQAWISASELVSGMGGPTL